MEFFFIATTMKKVIILLIIAFCCPIVSFAQTKASGQIKDKNNEAVPYSSVYFKNSTQGVIANESGKFYLESQKDYDTLVISFIGYKTKEILLPKSTNLDLKITLEEDNLLAEVKIYTGKTSKKDNPALDILRKIWARKKQNGLHMFKQYEYEKYEKVEFDMNSIDSAFTKKRIFKGMEFIFDHVDTSSITGKTYLPIFINEKLSNVYGDNVRSKNIEKTTANKNSGFNTNQHIIAFIKDLYADYDIYNNYLKFFDKDFISPLSRTGINVYNYILADSAYIDNKWCYNIVYYPRRKNELTFKGDFWVNDSTFAIKKINLEASKGANINWVKDIYIEQEFDVLNDSVFLLTKDYMMSDFSLSKKEKSKGVYGKRTTLFRNHVFDKEKDEKFYKEEVNDYNESIYTKSDEFWQEYRFEPLSKDELGIYKMLDTLQTVRRFKQLFSLGTILASEYIQVGKFDYGPIFSSFGYNDVEGIRLRTGGRTYFGPNDKWRLEGYTAYGFKDGQFKYGLSGKILLNTPNRLILYGGNRRDIEQIGVSLTETNNILGRSFASSSLFASGDNSKLTSINLSTLGLEIEPVKNLKFSSTFSFRTLKSASETFSLDYYIDKDNGITKSNVTQSEVSLSIDYTPNRRTIGVGVDRTDVDANYSHLFLNFSQGLQGVFNSDFDYQRLQFYYRQPLLVGGFGRLTTTFETGKTFGEVPLGLLNVVPGNQSYFLIDNAYSLMNYYEFVTDEYVSLHLEHNFNGRLFSRIPYLRDLNLREIVGIRGVYGRISDENIALNASNIVYRAPEDVYWEYHVGVGNIFKFFRIDFSWRGSYLDLPEAKRFGVKGSFGFYF